MKEQWKPLENFFNEFEISSKGRIRNKTTKKLRKIVVINNRKYFRVVRKGTDETAPVHILVAKTFIPNPDNKRNVIFKNNSRLDVSATNLKWTNGSKFNRTMEATLTFKVIHVNDEKWIATVRKNGRALTHAHFKSQQEATGHINHLIDLIKSAKVK